MIKARVNFNHLYYFWAVARAGSIMGACNELGLAQSTISVQLRQLEQGLDEQLFERKGRSLALTEAGEIALRYCEQIFALGSEMCQLIEGRSSTHPELLRLGVADTVPKILVHQMLSPLLDNESPIKLVVSENNAEQLLGDLAIHKVDAVILDCPMPPSVNVRAYNHLMTESGVSFACHRTMRNKVKGKFPSCLESTPLLLPTHDSAVRIELDRWFEKNNITPVIQAEIQDSALLKVFGRHRAGIFPIPTIIEKTICHEMDCVVLGRINEPIERYFLITTEKRLRNPVLRKIGSAYSARR